VVQPMQCIVSIACGDTALHGMLYRPTEPLGRTLVLCDPFAEEKKCAHRPLVDLSRALCAAGYEVLRFDYYGCGNSPGRFGDAGPARWLDDIRAALGYARQELGAAWLGLAGLRVGAALADAIAAADTAPLECLILLEPVIDGKRTIAQNLRRSMVKAMLTDGEQFRAEDVSRRHASDVVDFDGYEVSAACREALEALYMPAAPQNVACPCYVLNIGTKDEPAEPYVRLAEAYPRGTAEGVRLEPFWTRIGLMDAGPVIDKTLHWLQESCGDRGG